MPRQVIIGLSNRYEWLFYVNPDNPNKFMREQDGRILMEERPTTTSKFMKECRGLFGVMMKEDVDGNLIGHRMRPFNYILKKVVGPAKYNKKFWEEVCRDQDLFTGRIQVRDLNVDRTTRSMEMIGGKWSK